MRTEVKNGCLLIPCMRRIPLSQINNVVDDGSEEHLAEIICQFGRVKTEELFIEVEGLIPGKCRKREFEQMELFT